MGKGDRARKVDRVKFNSNWDAIFRANELENLKHDWDLMYEFIAAFDEDFTHELRHSLKRKKDATN